LQAVVDGLGVAAALPQDLPVFESRDDVFDTCSDLAVCPVVVVADDPAGVVTLWTGDRGDAALATVAEDGLWAVEQLGDGGAGNDDVVGVAGPALTDGNDMGVSAPMMIWVLMLRR
jgi:hypothetical protein